MACFDWKSLSFYGQNYLENGDFTISEPIDTFSRGTVQVFKAFIEDVHGNIIDITTSGPDGDSEAFSHLPKLEFNRGIPDENAETDAIDNSKSVLLYNYRNPVEGYSISTPENKDIFAIIIDSETGQALGDQVQISSEHGHDRVIKIETTEDGGFTILYHTEDLGYLENENRFENFNKSIFKEFDNDLNLVSSFIGPQKLVK